MKKLCGSLLVSLLVAFVATRAEPLVPRLDNLKMELAAAVTTELAGLRSTNSYTVVWREYEDAAITAFCVALQKRLPELSDQNFDRGKSGSEKNRLADLAIRTGGEVIEISVKASRASQNPENDLGTFHDHTARRRLFAASFTLWVRYDDAGPALKVDRVFFDRSYRFVGKSTLVDGVKYRKKDGNMRPKPWSMFDSGESPWKSDADFEAAVKRSAQYRANTLVQEYLADLTDEDQRLMYEELKKKFEK